MKLKKNILAAMLVSALVFTGCGNNKNVSAGNDSEKINNTDDSDNNSASGNSGKRISASDVFSDRDLETGYDESSAAFISLNGESASCDSNAVNINGNKVIITDEGTYIVSGTLQDGMLVVNADKSDKVQIVLKGADISNSTSAALYVLQADKVFITTAAGTENTLSNGGTYEAIDENNIDSVIYSKDDLTLNGEGSLTIKAEAGHGVVSKDSLVLTSGEYNITAENHGISGKDDVSIADGSYVIISGKDGIHAENSDDASLGFVYIANGTFDITAEGDGISGAVFGQIANGSFKIKTGGGSGTAEVQTGQDMYMHGMKDMPNDMKDMPSGKPDMKDMPSGEPDMRDIPSHEPGMRDERGTEQQVSGEAATEESTDMISTKGIKADGDLYLDGGEFEIDSADDSIHSNGNVDITNGNYQIASGDDGVHADSDVSISDGTVNISQSYEGIEGNTINISGGDISLISTDDGLNASGGADGSGYGGRRDSFSSSGDSSSETEVYISISGGNIHVDATGDGIDSNGNLMVSGGEIYVSGPSVSGNGALDYNGEATISGGIFVATSISGMVQNFGSSSTQGAMLVSTDEGAAGDEISLTDSDGNVLISWTAEKSYSCVNISCPELLKGETYTFTAGSTVSEITMSDLIYNEGSGAGRGGGKGYGGMGGHRGSRDMKQM